MGKVVAIEHVTLDGVMQGPGRPDEDRRDGFEYGGWSVPGQDPAMFEVQRAHMSGGWALLVGRVTYEMLAGFWPKQPANPITDSLNSVRKYVASATLTEPLPWQNSTLLEGDAADAVAKLKEDRDETLVIFGSGGLVQSLARRDLVDEYVLMIHPVVLGQGRRLFPDGSPRSTLSLADSVITPTGVILATYRPAAQR